MTALRLAHRGDHRVHAENSIAALVAATAVAGCEGAEFDVRFSGDGEPIVLHDETLERIQHRPERAADCSARDLERFGIPTLGAVLAVLPPAFFLDIELKAPATDAFAAVLVADRSTTPRAAAIASFEPTILAGLSPLLAGWPRWLNVLDLSAAAVDAALAAHCAAVAVRWPAIDGPGLRRARAAGLAVVAWTVRRRPTRERLARLGLAAICVEGRALEP
jgi:glycerophosphoryl diester phosphodiesterase